MPQPFDIASVLTHDRSAEFVASKYQRYIVPLADGPLEMAAMWLFYNQVFWTPLVTRGLPVCRRHTFFETELTKSSIKVIADAILDDVRQLGDDETTGIKYDLAWIIETLFNRIHVHLGAYQRSTSIFELAETLLTPEMQAAVQLDIEDELRLGIDAVEKKLDRVIYPRVLATAGRRDLASNVLYPFQRLGIVSTSQLPQVLCAAGTRTDVNDMMILTPVRSSYLRGLQTIQEYAIESLSAKKSIYYNATGMPDSQYANRKQQILASVLERLYPGDCGSTVTLPFEVLELNHRHVVGKYYVEGGVTKEVTKTNSASLVGKILQLRSPMACRHIDGICHACGGRLTDYQHPSLVPGIAAVIEVMGPTGQLILSNKHVAKTYSSVYALAAGLQPIMQVVRNEVYIRERTKLAHLMLGTPSSCMSKVNDLQHIEETVAFNDQQFSEIRFLSVANSETGELVDPDVAMEFNGAIPYFSSDFLMYMKHNPDMVTIGDMIWVKMAKWDTRAPILRCIVINDSMMRFVNWVNYFVTTGIASYKSAAEALRVFSNFIHRKVDANLMHLEIILRASMITDSVNYNLPVVTDVNNVRFGPLMQVIPRRSLGGQFAFERFNAYIIEPTTFVIPKPPGHFDAFMGFVDE